MKKSGFKEVVGISHCCFLATSWWWQDFRKTSVSWDFCTHPTTMHFLQTHMFLVIENKVLQEYRKWYVVVYMFEGSSHRIVVIMRSYWSQEDFQSLQSADLFSIYLFLPSSLSSSLPPRHYCPISFCPTSSSCLPYYILHIILSAGAQGLLSLWWEKKTPWNHLQYILLHGFSYMFSMIHIQCRWKGFTAHVR